MSVAALFVIGCASSHYTIRTRNAAGVPFLGHQVVLVGDREFTQLADLKKFVVSLPPGTELIWDTGSIRYDRIPLANSDMTLEAFGDFCREHGIRFRLSAGFGKTLVTRVYPLHASGFRRFIRLVSSPVNTAAGTGRAFAQCGMPYARDLAGWFGELGVPFGTGATIAYDRDADRLIVQNTRAAQAMVSDIVAWCNAREFDQKMDCLESHLRETHPATPAANLH
jgi:hypothetical protein